MTSAAKSHKNTAIAYPEADISHVEFYLMGSEAHAKASSCNIISKDLFSNNRPLDQGIYSLSMGTTSYSYLCKTCVNPRDKCPGHFGSIQVKYPVTNALFRTEILRWLKLVCHNCGEALGKISDEGIAKMSNANGKVVVCKSCEHEQPSVFKDPKEPLFLLKRHADKEDVRMYNDEIEQILSRVSKETVLKINPSIKYSPNDLMLRTLPAIPNNARPDVQKMKGGGRSNNNDTTTFLKNVVSTNESIPLLLTDDDRLASENALNLLEITYSNMVKDPTGSIASSRIVGGNGQALTSLASRLRGKEGRIRGNLEGKRIHWAGRTVIVGDNNINIDEVGIPIAIAKVLQVPEVVRPYNIDQLMTYFLNKNQTYPGCSKIVKADTGATYFIESMRSDITLEYGDTIYRDMIDGDHVAMNRAPSLLYSAISGHRARILPNGDTFRLSVNVADTLYGGDFDGDAMSIYPPHSIITRNECAVLSSLKRWFISYKDRSPAMGVYHDNLIGMFELTKVSTKINRFNTMRLLSQVEYSSYLHRFKPINGGVSGGAEIISLLLPEINYHKTAAFYKPEYSSFIEYNPLETQVEIKHGKIIKGRLDKKSLGQGVNDSLFHNVYNEYGVDAAMNLLYNMQQVSTKYLLMRGYTINYDDIAIKKDILKRINDITASILYDSSILTKKYRAGLITPPIGMTVEEFYEQEQMAILSPGDSFTQVVMESLDHENNNLCKLVESGTKGKPTNILQMSATIGPMSIKGKRMRKVFGYERALPYARRFHDEPEAVGFIPESFVTGVSSLSAIAQQQDGRNGITTKALSTGITGYHNRKCNKSLEATMVNNLRQVMKYELVVQQLYGDDGVDIRKAAYVNFSAMMVSTEKFYHQFEVEWDKLSKPFQNSTNKQVLEQEMKDLITLRGVYRTGFSKIESCNFKDVLLSGQQVLPVNVYKILENLAYNHSDYLSEVNNVLSPIEWKTMKDQIKERLPYTHFNEMCERNRIKLPDHILISFTLMNMSIDMNLCYKNIFDKKIDAKLMTLIADRIIFTYKKSLVEYGTSIGMIASECTSESMTQRILDSIHASGVSKANFLTRIKEVYGGKKTEQLGDPYMDIFVKDEYSDDISTMQQIANEIEMMSLKTFTTRVQVFFESYKNIVHPEYKDETKTLFGSFEKHFVNQKPPTNLIKWCVRIELSHSTMIEKTMQISTIYRKLTEQHPLLYIVYTDDNAEKIVMRIYMQKDLFKKDTTIDQHTIHEFIHSKLLKTVIRGVEGIQSAVVLKEFVPRSVEQPDGSMKVIRKHIIRTSGTNLKEILNHSMINLSKTSSNSIMEIQELYGIDAARMKLIQCLRELSGSDINIKHYTLIADTLTFNGFVSNIEKSGLEESNAGNPLLSISFSHPIQKITEAALRNDESVVHSNISSSLMLGTTPDIGSNYNGILMNERFIEEHTQDVVDLLDAM
jgi:DNA-directed RNA polymerase II subunit RPB1